MMNKLNERFLGFCETKQILVSEHFYNVTDFEWTPVLEENVRISEIEMLDSLVLGKKAERFFTEWIRIQSEFHLIAENIQVFENGITLGEFDFFLHSGGQPIHVELVYKFYLYDPEIEGETNRWIGPNRKDSFAEKLLKLKEKQFPLLQTKSAAKALDKIGLDRNVINQQVLFLANRFVPLKLKGTGFDEDGYWMKIEDFQSLYSQKTHFFIPEKEDWFIRKTVNVEWVDFETIKQGIRNQFERKRSPMVWIKTDTLEFERIFVVGWDQKDC